LSDTYLRHVSTRVVRMFELYSRNIDPEDTEFQTYIQRYISAKDPRKPESIQYSELYKMIKEGIREYIHKMQGTERRSKK
jgi:hypothetical protein